ncbi:MAG TPA: hypothetical protein VFL59_01470 [Candidatus Nanopelagicales bacterium]|nr:hypothetical protein [Candidatus Nanopelagicales bacterium]
MIAAASAVVFAATATGSALAWNGSIQPVDATTPTVVSVPAASTGDAPATRATVAPAARPAAAVVVVVKATPRRASAPAAKATVAKKTATKPARKAAAAPKTITNSRYVDAPGSQAAIDRCKLVLWTHSPLWLAGHNWCGYQWMAFVRTGTTVRVTSGAARGTYVVTGHVRLTRQSGSLPHLNADLVLQTCVGSGTGLTLLRRV